MKLVIEATDIAEVKDAARGIGVVLTNEEARAILENNRSYAGEVYKWGATDTDTRIELGRILKRMGYEV